MLEATPKEMKKRTALRVNPCKTCEPVGAMYAALGVHRCMPHSHGSQGCCSYHRTFLARHFKEPAIATTSSFTEGASVFGGGSNLKKAVTEALNEHFAPIRARRAELAADPGYLAQVLHEGNQKADAMAEQTLAEVRAAMQMDY